MTNKKTRIRRNKLPRASKLRGKLARLQLRQQYKPSDSLGMHYIMPGSMK
jgi:hypothetical protein